MEDQIIVNLKVAQELGLLSEEFERIEKILGRTPNFTELSLFSVMWSEHCSYKNSIVWLKTLPKEGSRMLIKAGEENAGLVNIGDGLGCVFKIESHNHPSAIAPYDGAATGVGGVNRDIFTMGARPIAQLKSLHFGNIEDDYTKGLVKGVVKGIADYGNNFGAATVGGEVFFDDCYQSNPLVNAMSVGIVRDGETALATSYGVGNPIYIVGASTGRDGIHGAASASKEISEESVNDFSVVPKGNPLLGKALMEASLEVIKKGAVIGMQDMGAAGIICSSSEMSTKGEHGMSINLNKVPLREEDMQPFEILLSESQERLLIVVKKGSESQVEAVFEKWDINCNHIGEVTNTGKLKYYFNNELVANVPAYDLVLGGGAPFYYRDYKEPAYFEEYKKFEISDVEMPPDLRDVAQHLIAHPNIASKQWIIDQYNTDAGGVNLTANKPSDAAIVSIEGTEKAIALTVDCNARYVKADPRNGAAIAVVKAARNVVCAGGEPLAITNCLNLGNPYQPEVYWQFVETIKGMSEACLKFNTPVTSGNVSFYNQSSEGKAVFPTPTIGMLGLLEDVTTLMTLDFKAKDDFIYLIGESVNDISSSQYLTSYHKIDASPAPYFDIDKELDMHQAVKYLINKKLIVSAHDVSGGGLYIALLESAMPNNFGFAIESDSEIRKDAFLFGEGQGRVIVSVKPENRKVFVDTMTTCTVDFTYLGVVAASGNVVDDEMYDTTAHAKSIYDHVLHSYLGEV